MKLPLLIVATAVSIAAAATLVASYTSYHASERVIESNLSLIASTKRDELLALLNAVRSDLAGAAGNPAVQHSLDSLAVGFKILSPEVRSQLRTIYSSDVKLSNNAAKGLADFYGSAYAEINPWFQNFAKSQDYDDILFIDRDGNIVYSLARRTDFGQNVASGQLDATLVAKVFGSLKDAPASQTLVTDFAGYEPAGKPVAFAAIPVYQRLGVLQDFVGVLLFQLPDRAIDGLVNKPDGFGAQGEALIAGSSDGLLRSNSRFGRRDDVLRTRFEDPLLTSTPADGRVAYTKGYRGSMIAAAVPLETDGLHWSVIAADNTAEVFRPVGQTVLSIVGISFLATLLLVAGSIFVARRMARPVVELVDRFEAALGNMPHGLAMFDESRQLILCNVEYRQMYELPAALTARGTRVDDILAYRMAHGSGPLDLSSYFDVIAETALIGKSASVRISLMDGRTVQVAHKPMASGGYVTTHQDVTDAIRAEAQIKHMALHDALTGLPNRLRLRDKMNEAIARVQRGENAAVLCVDLDHFKAVNDTLGHPIGDLLLKSVAERLLSCLRETDTLARLGGDEFVVLQTAIERPEEAGTLARRLIDVVCEPFDLDGHQVVVGGSVGISYAPDDGDDATKLLKNADMALYRAKAEGRGAYRFFETEMDARLQQRRKLEIDLRRALQAREFQLFYQPLVDTKSEVIIGFEALLRWNHPERGLVSPMEFIPVAEEIGLIVPLGEWALRQACMEAVTWPKSIKVAVNLSPVQFKNATLVHSVISALGASGLSPTRLELEITESVLLTDHDTTLAILHQLRGLGIRIAMDDFGTGYSSLSYLRSFPFDKIKIDRSFVKELGVTEDSAAIVKAVAGLGASLGMATTAEGVETSEQLAHIRLHGCTEVQGYYFSAPRAASDIPRLLGLDVAARA